MPPVKKAALLQISLFLSYRSLSFVAADMSCHANDLQSLMVRFQTLKTETSKKDREYSDRLQLIENEFLQITDGGWSNWGEWSTCGGGIRTRTRDCSSPAPSKLGKQCLGNTDDVVPCNTSTQQEASSTYVRWGRTTCPADTELVYKGYAGGSQYTDTGGAANWLCLTDQPQWGYYEDSVASGAQVYGAEYEFGDFHSDGGIGFFVKNLNYKDAPCSVCKPLRSSVIMVPGRLECFPGWKKEYSGYIVSGVSTHFSASEFICLDSDAEMVADGDSYTGGRTVSLAEAVCGTLRCPSYVNGRELTCVVCSK